MYIYSQSTHVTHLPPTANAPPTEPPSPPLPTTHRSLLPSRASVPTCACAVPGFSDAVRENIIHLLGITFQRMHKAVLASYLNLTPPEIDAMVKARTSDGWRVQSSPSGELVCLPKNDLNTTVVKRTQDVIRLDQVAPVLRSVTVGFY
eukprot:364653-Chlamydomonas_euryale.AAC.8